MANGYTTETRRSRIHPCGCVCGNGEVLATCALCCGADVVRAGNGVLGYPQCCPFILADHNGWQVVVEAGRSSHCNGVSSNIVDDENCDGACRVSVRNLLAEGACPAVDDCKLAGGGWVNAGAAVGMSVE